jgi:5-methylcytosine-specific restriction endonuclease McrA
MPTALPHPCIQPGCGVLVYGTARCNAHQLRRPTRTEQGWDNNWLRLSKQMIHEQPWCSLCYSTEDLTLDHIMPLGRGGASVRENAQVLCRSCNSRKGART